MAASISRSSSLSLHNTIMDFSARQNGAILEAAFRSLVRVQWSPLDSTALFGNFSTNLSESSTVQWSPTGLCGGGKSIGIQCVVATVFHVVVVCVDCVMLAAFGRS